MGTSQCLSDLLGMVAAFQCIVASVDEPNESLTREVENDFLGLASSETFDWHCSSTLRLLSCVSSFDRLRLDSALEQRRR
jgi:hypothetical protein